MQPNTSESGDAPSVAPAVVADDLPCRDCGYLLRGLSVEGRCPECGSLVLRTLTLVGNLPEPAATADALRTAAWSRVWAGLSWMPWLLIPLWGIESAWIAWVLAALAAIHFALAAGRLRRRCGLQDNPLLSGHVRMLHLSGRTEASCLIAAPVWWAIAHLLKQPPLVEQAVPSLFLGTAVAAGAFRFLEFAAFCRMLSRRCRVRELQRVFGWIQWSPAWCMAIVFIGGIFQQPGIAVAGAAIIVITAVVHPVALHRLAAAAGRTPTDWRRLTGSGRPDNRGSLFGKPSESFGVGRP